MEPIAPKFNKELVSCLRSLCESGVFVVTAGRVADLMYPDAKQQNSNGQCFNLSSGTVGRMLRRTQGVYENRPRVWTIEPSLLPDARWTSATGST